MQGRALVLAALLAPLAAMFGGWGTITVERVPDYGVAAEPLNLEFTVRQHGRRPVGGLRPEIEARSGARRVVAPARAAAGMPTGRYVGTLQLEPGDWTITVHSGFGKTRLTLLPIPVVSSSAAAPMASELDRGRRLFVGKGCVTCHVHRDAPAGEAFAGPVGPDLTERRYSLDYLGRFLADPGASANAADERRMPNLGLDSGEIAALVAFINTDRSTYRSPLPSSAAPPLPNSRRSTTRRGNRRGDSDT